MAITEDPRSTSQPNSPPGDAVLVDAVPGPKPLSQPRASQRFLALLAASLVAGAVLLRVINPGQIAWLQAAILVFSSVLIQATPFVLIGALAAAFIEVFVHPSTLDRLAKLPKSLQLPAAGLAGIAFPICECGSVPVARRLIAKGVAPGAALTFMLAAPVVNPVVMVSTYVAYRGRGPVWEMVAGRFLLGLLVSIAVGWVLGAASGSQLLRKQQDDHPQPIELSRPEPKWRTFFVHLGNDFLYMGRFLILGAVVAALVQTFLPQQLLGGLGRLTIVSIFVMMALAFVLSLCSQSDAFIAASFVQFGFASQLAFLVFGPMVDLKLGAIYAGTFRKGMLRALTLTAGAATLVGVFWFSVIVG